MIFDDKIGDIDVFFESRESKLLKTRVVLT